ncbi:hypothetical protein MPSEU_000849200 [Mayamaea pseudoterrestris]|nr:hypothetical protein MPSEU_000849200 [Mayamaea pseudoterrestris]
MASDLPASADGAATTAEVRTAHPPDASSDLQVMHHCDDERENNDKGSTIEHLEIEMDDDLQDTLEADLSLDELEAEEAGLIQNDAGKHRHQQRLKRQAILCDYQKIEQSNCHVLFPRFFFKNGFGMVGPHWFGPACILAILVGTSTMFTSMGFHIGPLTGITSIMFTVMTAYNLFNTSLRDPGLVILNRQEPPLEHDVAANEASRPAPVDEQAAAAAPRRKRQRWCWCEVCQAHQPPDAAHCPDCNVCIRGFDHHCVWMGTCIGRDNFKQFMRFNLSWLGYLAYCIVWISLVGPLVTSKVRHVASGDE